MSDAHVSCPVSAQKQTLILWERSKCLGYWIISPAPKWSQSLTPVLPEVTVLQEGSGIPAAANPLWTGWAGETCEPRKHVTREARDPGKHVTREARDPGSTWPRMLLCFFGQLNRDGRSHAENKHILGFKKDILMLRDTVQVRYLAQISH